MSRLGDVLSKRIFYIPAVVYLILFALLPLLISVYLSLQGQAGGFNPSTYLTLFELTDFPRVVYNTLVFAIGTAVFSILIGTAFAILVSPSAPWSEKILADRLRMH